jgi:hypothetical protein
MYCGIFMDLAISFLFASTFIVFLFLENRQLEKFIWERR